MTAFFTGDIPASALIVVPVSAGNLLDLTPFDSVTVTLLDPTNTPVTATFTTDLVSGDVQINWPSTSPFALAGIYSFTIALVNTISGIKVTADPFRFVVQQNDGWHTLGTARADWTSATKVGNDVVLYKLLTTARDQVINFAPALGFQSDGVTPVLPPQNYVDAQLMQARNNLNAQQATRQYSEDGDANAPIPSFPLDWAVKHLLRPQSGVPNFG
jgi:hypothetical protein